MKVAPTTARLAAMNAGRVQGVKPYPIVGHCPWHDDAVVRLPDGTGQAVDNVLPGDDVALEHDSEIGLTFMMHAFCADESRGRLGPGRILELRQTIREMREALQGFEELLELADRLRLEHDGEYWVKRLDDAKKAIGHADAWLMWARRPLNRFYQLMPPIDGFPGGKPWRGPLIPLFDAEKALEKVRGDERE